MLGNRSGVFPGRTDQAPEGEVRTSNLEGLLGPVTTEHVFYSDDHDLLIKATTDQFALLLRSRGRDRAPAPGDLNTAGRKKVAAAIMALAMESLALSQKSWHQRWE